jgi:GMP synthase (glutamine-hydrolysing)
MANEDKKIFTVQFHPEVSHTEEGSKMLENFVLTSASLKEAGN